jgi:hypothetical protein
MFFKNATIKLRRHCFTFAFFHFFKKSPIHLFMTLRLAFLIASAVLFLHPAQAQQNKSFTVSGYVKDASTGESLLGTVIYIVDSAKGTQTNSYGFYSITLPAGNYTMVVSLLSYTKQQISLTLDHDVRQNIALVPLAVETEAVTITAEREDKNVQSTDMARLPWKSIRLKNCRVSWERWMY